MKNEIRVKELMELANIAELKAGSIYVLVVDSEQDVPPRAHEMFEPADVRIVQIDDPAKFRIFELQPAEVTE